MKQAGFVPVLIILIVAVIALGGGFLIYQKTKTTISAPTLPPQQTTTPLSVPSGTSDKLRVCPDDWFEFLSPVQALDSPYYGQKGQFITINGSIDLIPTKKFDLEWVRKNCEVSEPEPVG